LGATVGLIILFKVKEPKKKEV